MPAETNHPLSHKEIVAEFVESLRKPNNKAAGRLMENSSQPLTIDQRTNTLTQIKALQAMQYGEPRKIAASIDQKAYIVENDERTPAKEGEPQHYELDSTEPAIQALRYFHGMQLIAAKYPGTKDNKALLEAKIMRAMLQFSEEANQTTNAHELAKRALALENRFAIIIKETCNVSLSAAHKQVTMARDIGILLEEHLPVQTRSRSQVGDNTIITIETSVPVRVQGSYYHTYFPESNIEKTEWLKNASEYAGFKPPKPGLFARFFRRTPAVKEPEVVANNWLVPLFQDKKIRDKLIENGTAAPPSARWLPLPANLQRITTHVSIFAGDTTKKIAESTTSFIRTGILTTFELKSTPEQKRLAKAQLREILEAEILNNLVQCRELYDGIYPQNETMPFFINYQTLLTPHVLEARAYGLRAFSLLSFLKDNNAMFVKMAHETMAELQNNIPPLIAAAAKSQNVDLFFNHTNAAINHRSDWPSALDSIDGTFGERNLKIQLSANVFERILANYEANFVGKKVPDVSMRFMDSLKNIIWQMKHGNVSHRPDEMQLEEVANFIQNEPLISNRLELRTELAMRLRASFHLTNIILGSPEMNVLANYQKNLMMAALEFLATGRQSMNLDGCKSARDRTAIFAAVIKTMQENPKAMTNWSVLSAGITKSLQQGHHFRALMYHVAVVKVTDVHNYFSNKLPASLKQKISSLMPFSKTIKNEKNSIIHSIIQKLKLSKKPAMPEKKSEGKAGPLNPSAPSINTAPKDSTLPDSTKSLRRN